MSHMLRPQVLLLKEGTEDTKGKAHVVSNIRACLAVTDILKTTLGPRGMDKLIHDGRDVTITNDGATVLCKLNIVHPAAQVLVDIAKSQDAEVGDGTTSVALLAGEFLKEALRFVEDGMHARIIIKAFREGARVAQEWVRCNAVKGGDAKETLLRLAATALNSKLVAGNREYFANMVVDAVMQLEDQGDRELVGIKQVHGGSVTESFLVDGVAFKKTFS